MMEATDEDQLPRADDETLAKVDMEEVDLVQELEDLGIKKSVQEPKADEDDTEKQEEEKVEPPSQFEIERGQLTAELMEKDNVISNLEKEVASLKCSLMQGDEAHSLALEEAHAKYKLLQEESEAKIEELKKQFNNANRDKEAMVMKYAMGEREVIIQRRGKEDAEKKLKFVKIERDELNNKIKTLTSDKTKIQQLADSRLQDVSVLKKDIERWKEEVKVQEAKACVASSRLKTEVEAHRETREQLDKTIKHLSETRQEIEVTRKECADFMQRLKNEDEEQKRKTKTTEIEQSAKLIIDAAAANELEQLRDKYKKIIDENNTLSQKIQKIEKESLASTETISKLKETVATQKQEISDLMAQVAELESVKMQLLRSEEKCEAKQQEIDRLRADLTEVNEDMSACRRKEAELLEFTQRLTDKNVTLQSDLASAEGRVSTLEMEHSRLAENSSDVETQMSQTRIELEEERKKRKTETELLARKLAEKSKQAEALSQQVIDAENEVLVLKRKNAASLRELTRELQTCQKKLLDLERSSSSNAPTTHPSRASSNSSLNRLAPPEDLVHNGNGRTRPISPNPDHQANGHPVSLSMKLGDQTHHMLVPESQILVEKIVALQKSIAKKQEKLEFLEEHLDTLTEEVKKKNKIIQSYVMTMESGALASSESDSVKRKMSESGGIMASLYSSKPSDSGMTLELSLEINQKLQAVLEDTLLKNITLKENINTLGNEIAKISRHKSAAVNDR